VAFEGALDPTGHLLATRPVHPVRLYVQPSRTGPHPPPVAAQDGGLLQRGEGESDQPFGDTSGRAEGIDTEEFHRACFPDRVASYTSRTG
jgi:hypothetical protein